MSDSRALVAEHIDVHNITAFSKIILKHPPESSKSIFDTAIYDLLSNP